MKHYRKIILGSIFVCFLLSLYAYLSNNYPLDLSMIKNNLDKLKSFYDQDPLSFSLVYFVLYLILSAISFPGITLISILGGAIMDLWVAVLVISIASTLGSGLAFLSSRYFLRNWIKKKYSDIYQMIDQKIKADGNRYLLTLRLLPQVPFVLLNLVMGLTSISLKDYLIISFFGMLPGIFLYVYSGVIIYEIQTPHDLLNWQSVIVLTLLACLPWLGKLLKK